jgi:PTH1 family peptidyl-tRNA hydrolase
MEDSYLIAGLGNPGAEYARTRHNAGFMVTECLAKRWRIGWRLAEGLRARLAVAALAGRRCLLCQPQTYMNASGEAVAAVMRYYRVGSERLLVAVDDADLPLGDLRLRARGGTSGHHGLESVEQHLGAREYARLRLGIGRRVADGRQITGHVLGAFSPAEAAVFEQLVERAAEAAVCWLEYGVDAAMNRFNGPAVVPEQRKTE